MAEETTELAQFLADLGKRVEELEVRQVVLLSMAVGDVLVICTGQDLLNREKRAIECEWASKWPDPCQAPSLMVLDKGMTIAGVVHRAEGGAE